MVEYFEDLFKSSDTSWAEVINCMTSKITGFQNEEMLRPVDDEEVRQALFHMHLEKSPGPDGMSPAFYQKFWNIVRNDIIQLVRNFFLTCSFDEHLTDTNIVLIPKKKSPGYMTDLRPISLCNVVYKIVSKVLANRLKGVMDKAISESQSAFVPGRLITDNIMISYEVMHYMKRKTKGKIGWMALKCKISHAGREFGDIIPQRGLRQGDPLSSYLFLVCTEGFTSIIRDYERRGLIKGIQVARGAPSLSHMFFADDSYIYCQANEPSANHIVDMLSKFETTSGQKINRDKSSIFFSRNTKSEVKEKVCEVLNFHEANDNTHYLGLPNILGRKKSVILGYLKDRLQNGVQGWDKKYLSKGGKEILLKTVAQALPNYAMSIFLLPLELCRDMEKIMCRFWWKSLSEKNKGIHWMSWERMCKVKGSGGLGFRNLHDFNVAQLGKQGCRLIMNPQSVVSRVFQARYYPNGTFLSAGLGNSPSFIWRSVLEAQVLLKRVMYRRVGDGSRVSIKLDPWLPNEEDQYVHSTSESIEGQMVSSLMVPGQRRWDEEEWILGTGVRREWEIIQLRVRTCCYRKLKEVISSVFKVCRGKDLQLVAMLCWSLWKGRNALVWNNKGMVVSEIVESAVSILSQWHSAQDKFFDPSLGFMTHIDGDEHWCVPNDNMIKVNTDAAIFDNSQCFSFSAVARDHEGGLIEAISRCEGGQLASEVVEALGIKEALSWIKRKSWMEVVVETDSLVCVQAIRSGSVMLSYFGRVIAQCKQLPEELKDRNVSLKFVKRSANKVTHYLARHTCVISDRVWRVDNIHSEFIDVLSNDLKY
ncbi:uncharacterized protein LOC141661039 [Apium graveolens]|uniref:uncharacterized protein LOC141661039 n=1 Tax=Apium graveolens TaxID=4045 RepID=UPI003D7B5A21